MNRRGFLGMAAASIFVPQFGRFFREGSGTLYRPDTLSNLTRQAPQGGLVHLNGVVFRTRRWTTVTLSGLVLTGTRSDADLYGARVP